MKSGIYKIENLENGKVYVGSTTALERRWNEHIYNLRKNKHANAHLQSSFNKYGEEKFKYIIIETCDTKQLIEREQYWMDELNVINKGYNICPFADLHLLTDETKEKISKAHLGKHTSIETEWKKGHIPWSTGKKLWSLFKHPKGMLGKKQSKEFCEAQSKRMSGKNHPLYGIGHTEKTKLKMSNTRKGCIPWSKGKKFTKEHKENMSLAMKGRIPWNKDKNHPSYKAYIEKVTRLGKERNNFKGDII